MKSGVADIYIHSDLRLVVKFHLKGQYHEFFDLRFRIRIHRIHMFLGLLDPEADPLVRGTGMDPDPDPAPGPSITKQK
jgi:hypothetical protein